MISSTAKGVGEALRARARPKAIADYTRFFKCGPGQYGEGDSFIGVAVPHQREIVRQFAPDLSLADCVELLQSEIHEFRSVALMAMVELFKRAKAESTQGEIIGQYQANFNRVNNWDLVDLSAPRLTGPWYLGRDRSILFTWAASDHLWTRRIAIMTTFAFIRAKDFSTTLALADLLLEDKHDLMQKAVGWMLREVGNRDGQAERSWLAAPTIPKSGAIGNAAPRYTQMGRTMLRYAIEKFPKDEYQQWLKGQI